jgi:hypothetical protein
VGLVGGGVDAEEVSGRDDADELGVVLDEDVPTSGRQEARTVDGCGSGIAVELAASTHLGVR